MKSRKRSWWVFLRPVVFALLAVVALVAVTQASTSVRLLIMKMTGRVDADCGWRESVEAIAYEDERMAARNRVALQSRLVAKDGDLLLWQTPYGRSWISGAQTLEAARFRAPDLYHWPPRWAQDSSNRVVRSGDTVIDCGGHIGESSAMALRLGAALVVAVEPDPLSAEALRRNLAQPLAQGRLIVVEKAVWSKEGTLTLRRGEASPMSTTRVERSRHAPDAAEASGIPVPMTTIDRLVSDLKLPKVDVIKMDIEGAEREALKGARETIARFKPRLAIGSYHMPDDRQVVPAVVLDIRKDYTIRPARCLPGHGRIIPHELFFE
jgi:FkbM family methyltransferase